MDAAPRSVVIRSWLGVARVVAIAIALVTGIAGRALAQAGAPSRGVDAAGTLARPWHPSTPATSAVAAVARGARERRETTHTSHRDTDELGRPDEAPRAAPPLAFDLAVATHVPVSLGVEANLTLPLGFLLRAHFGFTPQPYIEVINGVARTFEAYDEPVAHVVMSSGANAFVFRASGGIRPVPGYGFEILGGYTLLTGGARVTTAELEAATGQSMSYPGLEAIGISGTMHAIHVEIGWTALAWDHLVIRGSIGWMHTLAAESALDVPAELRARARGGIEEIEQDIRDGMTTWGFTPEIRVGVGYQF